jgi:hypothetical protein
MFESAKRHEHCAQVIVNIKDADPRLGCSVQTQFISVTGIIIYLLVNNKL